MMTRRIFFAALAGLPMIGKLIKHESRIQELIRLAKTAPLRVGTPIVFPNVPIVESIYERDGEAFIVSGGRGFRWDGTRFEEL